MIVLCAVRAAKKLGWALPQRINLPSLNKGYWVILAWLSALPLQVQLVLRGKGSSESSVGVFGLICHMVVLGYSEIEGFMLLVGRYRV